MPETSASAKNFKGCTASYLRFPEKSEQRLEDLVLHKAIWLFAGGTGGSYVSVAGATHAERTAEDHALSAAG